MLEVAAVTSRYDRITALSGVSLHVSEGELVALVGANGAGKTTLLRTLSGVQPTACGSVRFQGIDITRLSPRERVRLGIVQVPEGRQVFGPLSVEENLRLGGFVRPAGEIEAGVAHAYELFPILADKRRDAAGTLSGGQQQMLAIGRGLASSPRLLMLDEPSMGLAPTIADFIFEQLIDIRRKAALTILLVEQRVAEALQYADHGYVLETGRVVLEGTHETLQADDRVRRAYLGM